MKDANAASHFVSAVTPLAVALMSILGVTVLSALGKMQSESAVAVFTAVLGYAAGHRSGVRMTDARSSDKDKAESI